MWGYCRSAKMNFGICLLIQLFVQSSYSEPDTHVHIYIPPEKPGSSFCWKRNGNTFYLHAEFAWTLSHVFSIFLSFHSIINIFSCNHLVYPLNNFAYPFNYLVFSIKPFLFNHLVFPFNHPVFSINSLVLIKLLIISVFNSIMH